MACRKLPVPLRDSSPTIHQPPMSVQSMYLQSCAVGWSIRLLAIVEPLQRRRFGREASRLVEDFARRRGLRRLQIAAVNTNPAHGFWQSAGFVPTGGALSRRGDRNPVERMI